MGSSIGRNLRRMGAVTAAASVALLGFTGVASAASGEGYASGPGVYGSANWVKRPGKVYQSDQTTNGAGCGQTISEGGSGGDLRKGRELLPQCLPGQPADVAGQDDRRYPREPRGYRRSPEISPGRSG